MVRAISQGNLRTQMTRFSAVEGMHKQSSGWDYTFGGVSMFAKPRDAVRTRTLDGENDGQGKSLRP